MVGPNFSSSLANGNKIPPAFVCHIFLGDIPYNPAPQEICLLKIDSTVAKLGIRPCSNGYVLRLKYEQSQKQNPIKSLKSERSVMSKKL